MQPEHTPIPWEATEDGHIHAPDGRIIITVWSNGPGGHWKADLSLAATSPVLLRACKAMTAAFTRPVGNVDEKHHALTLGFDAIYAAEKEQDNGNND